MQQALLPRLEAVILCNSLTSEALAQCLAQRLAHSKCLVKNIFVLLLSLLLTVTWCPHQLSNLLLPTGKSGVPHRPAWVGVWAFPNPCCRNKGKFMSPRGVFPNSSVGDRGITDCLWGFNKITCNGFSMRPAGDIWSIWGSSNLYENYSVKII